MDFLMIKHNLFLYKMEYLHYLHTQTTKIHFEKSEGRRGSGWWVGQGNSGEGAIKTGPSYPEVRVAEIRVIEVELYWKLILIFDTIFLMRP